MCRARSLRRLLSVTSLSCRGYVPAACQVGELFLHSPEYL
ncbi:unnamed protein product [Rhodiola kirilowii]